MAAAASPGLKPPVDIRGHLIVLNARTERVHVVLEMLFVHWGSEERAPPQARSHTSQEEIKLLCLFTNDQTDLCPRFARSLQVGV